MGIFDFLKKSFSGYKLVTVRTKRNIVSDWKNVESQLKGGSPSQLRQALITADKALDNALKDLVDGETMGERLKNAKNLFEYSQYDKLWKAHKMRNSVVHESGFEPPHHAVKKAVHDLKEGLTVLKVFS